MVIGCMLNCREYEKERLLRSVSPDNIMFFFNDESELLKSALLDKIEVMVGVPSIESVQKMKNLKWLQMTWAGTDIYTAVPVFPDNVILTNATGAFGKVISEYIIAGILAMYRKLFDYRNEMIHGEWEYLPGEQTLEGKTALILGAGDIGCETARKLKAFDVTTWGIRRVVREKPACFDEMHTMDELDNLLPEADLIIATLPGTSETAGLLSGERLLKMKKNAFLVNTGRGSLIPCDELVNVLNTGHLGGVLLDVTETEPLPATHPLRSFDRVMITPHISGISWGSLSGTRNKIIDICCDNLIRYQKGQALNNIVDKELGYRMTHR